MTRLLMGSAMALVVLTFSAEAQDFPKTPPAPGPLTPAAFPPFQETTLPNGLKILVVESHKQPVVSISLSFPAGAAYEPEGKEGLADMVAGLLTKGAGTRTAEEIAATVEGAGGSLFASGGNDFLRVSATTLTPKLDLAFELLADVVMRPTFPESEIELLRTQTLSSLQVELSQPSSIASRAFFKAIYGDHPYGSQATPASVRSITRQDLVTFHETRLAPSGSLLVLAGDINLDQARRLAIRAFQGWLGTPPTVRRPTIPNREATELLLVHRPGSVQSNILVGNLTYGPTDQRQYAATVANRILGGGADSRLFLILREEKSWTYGAYSSLARRMDRGYFIATAEVRTEVTDSALKELLVQVNRIRTEPVSGEELEAARGALVGSYPLSIETADQVAGAVATSRLYGLPEDYVQTYRVKLGAVSADDLRAAAESTIRPEQSVTVVVGDGAKIYDGIKDVAPIRIVNAEGEPLTPADLAPKTEALAIDPARVVARRDSFAIMVQGNALGHLTSTMEKTADGFRYTESTRVGGFVEQDSEILMDPAVTVQSVKQTGTVQGQATSIVVAFANGRAKGEATTPTPEGMKTVAIDTTIADGVIDDNMVQALLPALEWGPSAKWTFTTFSSSSGETTSLTLAVSATESVTTPSGTTEAYRAELTGGPQVSSFWVSVAAPHRLLKITIAGTPIEMLRVTP